MQPLPPQISNPLPFVAATVKATNTALRGPSEMIWELDPKSSFPKQLPSGDEVFKERQPLTPLSTSSLLEQEGTVRPPQRPRHGSPFTLQGDRARV